MEQTLGKQKQGTHRHCFAVSNHSSTRTSRCFYTILCRYRIAVLVRFGTCMSHWEGARFAEPHTRFIVGTHIHYKYNRRTPERLSRISHFKSSQLRLIFTHHFFKCLQSPHLSVFFGLYRSPSPGRVTAHA